MTTPHAAQPRFVALTLAGVVGLWGCASDPGPAKPRRDQDASVAIVDGVVIHEGELAPAMREIAGGSALEEHVLGVALERACREAGVRVTDADVERERDDLLGALVFEDGQRPDDRVGALEAVRVRRGLGPARFEALLRRNAMLRALVGDQGDPSVDEIDLALRIRHGERRRVRLIVTDSEQGAAAAIDRVRAHAAEVGVAPAFAEEATRTSIHPSAGAGGLIEQMSPADPAYPGALRDAVRDTAPGEITPIVGVDARWGAALVEAVIPADPGPASDAERATVAAELRRRKQRLAMDRLAGDLVRKADVVVLDPSVAWSFRARTGRSP